MQAREIAFLIFENFEKEKGERLLASWIEREAPSEKEIALAKELAYGCIKRWGSLEYLIQKLPFTRATQKEKRLLGMALYQRVYLNKIPEHALVFETVEIAKKVFGKKKGGWINALLRKMIQMDIKPPTKEEGLSFYYSYPPYFIETIKKTYPKEAESIFTAQNQTYLPCIRFLKTKKPYLVEKHPEKVEVLYEKRLTAARIKDKKWVKLFLETEYLQNVTPVFLIDTLASSSPKKVIDFCASPGGKLLCASLIWKGVSWFANDISKEKLKRLQENLDKQEVKATLLQGALEQKPKEKVDLAILDVPCSNSGVLGKKPEARWRLKPSLIKSLVKKQKEWIQKASLWVEEEGELWYMTCSILPEENEEVCATLEREGWYIRKQVLVLPNQKGWDGGFGCALQRKKRASF